MVSVFPVVLRRFAANARLLAAVIIGAILAAALMSTTAIYTDAIRDLGLKYAIRNASPTAINPVVRASSQTAESAVYQRNQDEIRRLATERLGNLLDGVTTFGRSSTFYPSQPGQPYPEEDSRPRSHIQFLNDADTQVHIVEGRAANDSAWNGTGPPSIEATLSRITADRLGIRVGDSFDLHPFFLADAEPVRLTVVGLIEAIDLDDPYWGGMTNMLDYPSTSWDTLPFIVSQTTFFDALGAYLPATSSDYWTLLSLDTGGLNSRNAELVRSSAINLQQTIGSRLVRTEMTSALPRVLSEYDEKLFFTRIPLLVLVLQIAAIVLYYLFMVSTMLVERQGPEIALLKSRGATTPQVMLIYLIEGMLIFLLAVGLGPPLAAAVISLLGQTPPFENLSGGANLSVRLSADAYLWAVGGALLAYATLLWPAYQATRRTVVQQRAASARPPKQSFFTRYYLDLALVGLGALLYYQLDRSGQLSTESVFGEQTIDPVRLLTPAFFLLSIGIVFLRLFPLVLRGLAFIVGRGQGAAPMIGMWHLVRNPVHYSRLVLLLMLATAVGTFAASFGTTLNHSYDDRAAYNAGSGLRLSAIRTAPATGPDALAEEMAALADASLVSPVLRLRGSPQFVGNQFSTVDFEILGVNPEAMGEVAYFRDDYANGPMPERLQKLSQDTVVTGLELPANSRYLGIWFNPIELRGQVELEIRILDSTGRHFSYVIGPRRGQELSPSWYFGVVDLQSPLPSFSQIQFEPSPPQGPLRVQSLAIRFGTRGSILEGALLLDDLQVSTEAEGVGLFSAPNRDIEVLSNPTIVESFDAFDGWQPIDGITPLPLDDQLRILQDGGHTVGELRWRPSGATPQTHGIEIVRETSPLPVLASRGFLTAAGRHVGDQMNIVVNNSYFPVVIVDDYDLFPTLPDPRSSASLIIDLNALTAILNANPRITPVYADELWFEPGAASEAVLQQQLDSHQIVANLTSFAGLRAEQEQDPLVAAGWEGILFISFAAILLLSAIGFLIYSYLTAQKRTLEFAVLRTMGFSKRQIALVVGFEQCFVIGLGMVAGTLLGLRLGTLMIRYMGVTETGDDALPPMVLSVSWATIGGAWLVLGAAFLVTIGIVVLLYSRLALHRVLRIGES